MRLVHLSISGKYENSFKQLYNISVLPQLQKMNGCYMADLIQSNSEQGKYISLTLWDNEENAELYENSDAFKNLSSQINMFLSESKEWKVELSDDYKLEYKPALTNPYRKNYSVYASTSSSENDMNTKSGMYTRIVSIKIEQEKLEEFKSLYKLEIIPALEANDGCSFAYLTEGINDKNEFLSVSIWKKKSDADEYEKSEEFLNLQNKVRHTFSKFYLWKMQLEENSTRKIETSEDLKIDNYTVITGKKFK